MFGRFVIFSVRDAWLFLERIKFWFGVGSPQTNKTLSQIPNVVNFLAKQETPKSCYVKSCSDSS